MPARSASAGHGCEEHQHEEGQDEETHARKCDEPRHAGRPHRPRGLVARRAPSLNEGRGAVRTLPRHGPVHGHSVPETTSLRVASRQSCRSGIRSRRVSWRTVAAVLGATTGLVACSSGEDEGDALRRELVDWLVEVSGDTPAEAECNADYMLDKGLTGEEIREFTDIPAGLTPAEALERQPSRNEVFTAASFVCNYDENGNAIERRSERW